MISLKSLKAPEKTVFIHSQWEHNMYLISSASWSDRLSPSWWQRLCGNRVTHELKDHFPRIQRDLIETLLRNCNVFFSRIQSFMELSCHKCGSFRNPQPWGKDKETTLFKEVTRLVLTQLSCARSHCRPQRWTRNFGHVHMETLRSPAKSYTFSGAHM